jgi:hypothetical protein
MNETFVFQPPRQRGLILLGSIALFLAAASAACFIIGISQSESGMFLSLLLLSLLLFAPLPLLLYRVYSLMRASYRIERDGLRLRWGLRAEDIPLPEIEWVRMAADLAISLPPPRLVWPGILRGTVTVNDLGPVEYMASTRAGLILVAGPHKIYAISPQDPEEFLRAFQRSLEMGSLSPFSSVSVLPAAYLSQIWSSAAARWVLASGFVLSLLLFMLTALVIPSKSSVSLGFYLDGRPLSPVPAEQILLLPILGSFVFLTDTAAGLFLYRREATRIIAYLVWSAAVLTQALFIGAIFLLWQASP